MHHKELQWQSERLSASPPDHMNVDHSDTERVQVTCCEQEMVL